MKISTCYINFIKFSLDIFKGGISVRVAVVIIGRSWCACSIYRKTNVFGYRKVIDRATACNLVLVAGCCAVVVALLLLALYFPLNVRNILIVCYIYGVCYSSNWQIAIYWKNNQNALLYLVLIKIGIHKKIVCCYFIFFHDHCQIYVYLNRLNKWWIILTSNSCCFVYFYACMRIVFHL